MPARDHPFNQSRRPLLERCHPQPQMLPKPERKIYNGFDDFNSIPRIRAAEFTVESGYPYGERHGGQDTVATEFEPNGLPRQPMEAGYGQTTACPHINGSDGGTFDDYAWRPLPRTPSPARPRRLLRATSSQRRPPVHVFGSAVNSLQHSCCQQDCTPVISKYSNSNCCSSNDTSTSSTGLPFAFQTHQHHPRLSDNPARVKERKSKSNRCNKVNNNKDAVPSIKCVVVGDGAVGKTNLIISYLENRFIPEHNPTASDIYNVDVQVDDVPVRVTICDTPGQDNLDVLRELSYPETNIFLLCFSVVHPETFHSVKTKWLPRLSQYQDARVVLIGTHADLRSDRSTIIRLQCQGEKPVSLTDAWDFARSIGAKYIESSSRTKDKVKEVFDTAIWDALTAQRTEPKPLWRKMLCLA